MNEYTKPNVILPISLHDAMLSRIESDGDMVRFFFDEGFFRVDTDQVVRTGESSIEFPNVDNDFCRVYRTGRNHVQKEYTICDFARKMKEKGYSVQIVDETYGYNQAKFSCSMHHKKKWFSVEIELYHFGAMRYAWLE